MNDVPITRTDVEAIVTVANAKVNALTDVVERLYLAMLCEQAFMERNRYVPSPNWQKVMEDMAKKGATP